MLAPLRDSLLLELVKLLFAPSDFSSPDPIPSGHSLISRCRNASAPRVPCYVSHTLEASAIQKTRDTQHMALTPTVPVPTDNGAPEGVCSDVWAKNRPPRHTRYMKNFCDGSRSVLALRRAAFDT